MNEMTDEQINQAVAECCGINDEWLMKRYDLSAVTLAAFDRNKLLPDFANSRDAMASALEKLDESERFEYVLRLRELARRGKPIGNGLHEWEMATVSARNQAIAFLKAKGKL